MNIFYLDKNIQRCARYHCDKHVIKMILESTQILCSVLHQHGLKASYKPTHLQHPCTLWAGESLENWLWLRELVLELDKEYRYRFNHKKSHRSALVAEHLEIPPLPSLGITERPQAMPEIYKIPGNPVKAYRQYYISAKSHLLIYTKREVPSWVMRAITLPHHPGI